jgi:hypothetical protein
MPRTDRRHGDRSDAFPLVAVGCDAEGPTSPVRGVPNAAERGACLRSASAPGVPIWAAPGWRRPSVWRVVRRPGGCARSPTRVRSAAPTAPAAECGSVCFAVGAGGLRACSWGCARNEISGIPLRSHANPTGIRNYRSSRLKWSARLPRSQPLRHHMGERRTQSPQDRSGRFFTKRN